MGIPQTILTALAQGRTVLTANQRAARTLRRAFDRAQTAKLWTPPSILALDTWLPTLFHQLLIDGAESRLLLNPVQEHALWRAIIAADREVSGLRSVDALADLAARAWHLLCLHNGRARLREFTVSTDTRAFQRWAEAFDRLCARVAYLTSAQLPAALGNALAEGNLPIPDSGLLLVDFDSHPPAHAELFDSIRRARFAVDELHTSVEPESAALHTAPDDASEMRTAALWAKQRLQENPTATVAIVVPNLADRRAQLDRVFSGVFETAPFLSFRSEAEESASRIGTAPANLLHEFSLGTSLAETAPVVTALDLLRWPMEPLPLGTIGALLLSPFFGAAHAEDALAAAEFDAFELRRESLLRPELTLDAMIDLVRESKRSQRIATVLRALYSLRRAAAAEKLEPGTEGPQKSHAGWADAFRNLLEAAGWTRATGRDSLAFQTRQRWESALDQLATLDFDGSRVTASAALRSLGRIARQAIFAPESREAPIQILGPLEPGGMAFDALWFLGADDRNWPSPAVRNPLIPWHIQRDLGIPGTGPIPDGALAQRLTTRLARSASQIVFSFARHSEDGERRPSPSIRAFDLTNFDPPAEPPREMSCIYKFVGTNPIPALPEGLIRGGARILELQAACAFRAFAEIRLHATQPDSRNPGLDARDRGIHVHRIMQDFWTRLQTQDALRALPLQEREAMLNQCIDAAIRSVASKARTPWEDAYLDVQRRRLRSLLLPWLDIELARPEFVVRQQEEKQQACIGPLLVEVRADRIDDTPDGPVLIDYKTGGATPSEWLSDRPDAPQLPLYAVLANETEALGGVAFALLRAGDELDLRGFTDSPGLLAKPGKMAFATLAEQVEDWRRVLTELAHAFAEDDPIANPKSYPETCKYCTQRILCRLDPITLEGLTEEEDA
jgi:probable DNA repair protein